MIAESHSNVQERELLEYDLILQIEHTGECADRDTPRRKQGCNILKNVVTSVWPADSRLSCFWRILFMRSKKSPFPLATLEIETDQFSCETFHLCLHLITQCGFKKEFPFQHVFSWFCFTVISIT